jgi:hypothetical protein
MRHIKSEISDVPSRWATDTFCMTDDPLLSLASEGDQSQADPNGAFGAGINSDPRMRWIAGTEEADG